VNLRGSQPFDDYLAVFEAQREFEEDLYSDLDTLFPDDHPERPALEKLVNKKNATGLLAALLEIFQTESQAIHDELRAARNARMLSLRMEAFLVGRAEGYDPVHIEHYDTLPQGQLRAVDRFQLDIDPAELRRMLQAYSDLAEAANKAKEEGGKLADVFAGVAPEFARRLEQLEGRLKELLAADGENSLSARAAATRASLVATRQLLEEALASAFDNEVARSWDAFQTQVVVAIEDSGLQAGRDHVLPDDGESQSDLRAEQSSNEARRKRALFVMQSSVHSRIHRPGPESGRTSSGQKLPRVCNVETCAPCKTRSCIISDTSSLAKFNVERC
jgi:hypothetical protein